MTKIEFFIVTTKNPCKAELELLKVELCELFGGLTVSAPARGYWLDNKKLDSDNVEIWLIYTDKNVTSGTIRQFAEQFKAICEQKVQLVVINDQPNFI